MLPRLGITSDPGNHTYCTLIGDTLNLDCSSVSPGQEVFILTPNGDEIKSNGTVSHSVNITSTSNGIYFCVVTDDLCGMVGSRISISVDGKIVESTVGMYSLWAC